jgi:hypothetical protein
MAQGEWEEMVREIKREARGVAWWAGLKSAINFMAGKPRKTIPKRVFESARSALMAGQIRIEQAPGLHQLKDICGGFASAFQKAHELIALTPEAMVYLNTISKMSSDILESSAEEDLAKKKHPMTGEPYKSLGKFRHQLTEAVRILGNHMEACARMAKIA